MVPGRWHAAPEREMECLEWRQNQINKYTYGVPSVLLYILVAFVQSLFTMLQRITLVMPAGLSAILGDVEHAPIFVTNPKPGDVFQGLHTSPVAHISTVVPCTAETCHQRRVDTAGLRRGTCKHVSRQLSLASSNNEGNYTDALMRSGACFRNALC